MAENNGGRKPRADSPAERVKAMMGAEIVINPPAKMRMSEDDIIAFNEIVAEFANVDWTAHTIRLAALLARTVTKLERDQDELHEDGSIATVGENGRLQLHPLHTAVQGATSQIMTFRRTLALHAMAAADKRTLGKGRHQNKESQHDAPDDDESLLNRPPQSSIN